MQIDISKKITLDRLQANGFLPKTIFDVGVATGTSGLYDTFLDAQYVLVDPLTECEPFMRDVCARFPGSLYRVAAAGASSGEQSIVVEPGLSGSSFFLKSGKWPQRSVPIITLDSVVDEHGLAPPFLVKLDVQGFEIEAMRGLTKHILSVEVVIAETSLWADRKGSGAPTTHELIAFMADRNLLLYDIAGIEFRPRDGAIAELDLVFCRADSKLREHASYKTPEQIEDRTKRKIDKFRAALQRLGS